MAFFPPPPRNIHEAEYRSLRRKKREEELLKHLESQSFPGAFAYLIGLIIDLEEQVAKLDDEMPNRRIGR